MIVRCQLFTYQHFFTPRHRAFLLPTFPIQKSEVPQSVSNKRATKGSPPTWEESLGPRATRSPPSRMTCSGAESFRADVLIDYDDGQVLSGCYVYVGFTESTSLLPIFSIGGGNETGQPAIFAYNSSSLGHVSEAATHCISRLLLVIDVGTCLCRCHFLGRKSFRFCVQGQRVTKRVKLLEHARKFASSPFAR